MRKIWIVFVSVLVSSCVSISINTKKESNNSSSYDEIDKVMNNWHLAATEANYNNYFSKMDSLSIFIGTDATENWTKVEFEAFCKPYFDKGKAWDF